MKDAIDPNPGIKTHIANFCREFAEILVPLERSLHIGLEDLPGWADSDALLPTVAGLTDILHQLEALVHKVEQQQAYVIIFGPLKSGKSTLMNAISGSYVSEVTSLPAYPCLVHVKHGDTSRFVVTRYSGEKTTFTDNLALHALIREGHQILADRLREVEAQGQEFDPGRHYPEAIRRIDVEVPAKHLKDSFTVLVDTPGLYSRMKFGYGLMAREFRNSAASAVFVVKTDNLFLEQVFDEFNDLLDLFSRIFLVVNIDAQKRDLSPDGAYRPSLESERPEEVIRAFEALAMSAPLRQAADDGRLRIYPIDLLGAAVLALKPPEADTPAEPQLLPAPVEPAETPELPAADPLTEPAAAPQVEPEIAPESRSPAFIQFLSDLTAYLNSSDYLREFMGDSLHRGKSLAAEIHGYCGPEALEEFRHRQTQLQDDLRETAERLAAVGQLDALNWRQSLQKAREANHETAVAFGQRLFEQTRDAALRLLVDWLDSDDSVLHLQEQLLNQLFRRCQEQVVNQAKQQVQSVVIAPLGGVELSQELVHALARIEEVIEPAVSASRDGIRAATPAVRSFRLTIDPDSLRVKKGFWDWVLFRSRAAVCRRVFGMPEAMDQPVPGPIKKRRLDARSRESLGTLVHTHLQSLLPVTLVDASDELLGRFINGLARDAHQRLRAAREELTQRQHALEQRRTDHHQIASFFQALTAHASSTIDSIEPVRVKFHAVDWETRGPLPEPGSDPDPEAPSLAAELDPPPTSST